VHAWRQGVHLHAKHAACREGFCGCPHQQYSGGFFLFNTRQVSPRPAVSTMDLVYVTPSHVCHTNLLQLLLSWLTTIPVQSSLLSVVGGRLILDA
jgi:hypothetical protein